MEEYEEALRLALVAGDRFNLMEKSQYVDTLISKCVDEYIALRIRVYDKKDTSVKVDPKMEEVINRMFDRCFDDGEFN